MLIFNELCIPFLSYRSEVVYNFFLKFFFHVKYISLQVYKKKHDARKTYA